MDDATYTARLVEALRTTPQPVNTREAATWLLSQQPEWLTPEFVNDGCIAIATTEHGHTNAVVNWANTHRWMGTEAFLAAEPEHRALLEITCSIARYGTTPIGELLVLLNHQQTQLVMIAIAWAAGYRNLADRSQGVLA